MFDALLGRGQTAFDELELVLNRLQFAAVVAAAVGLVVTPLSPSRPVALARPREWLSAL